MAAVAGLAVGHSRVTRLERFLCEHEILRAERQTHDDRGRYVRGSWDPAKFRWGKQGGRIYTTAMAALSLEVPFRFLRIYRAAP